MSWALGMALIVSHLAQGAEIQILYSEIAQDIRVIHKDRHLKNSVNTKLGRVGIPLDLQFLAHGKRFHLTLADNKNLPSTETGLRLLSGSSHQQENSWSRINLSTKGISGIVYDGEETFFLEPSPDTVSGTRVTNAKDIRLTGLVCGSDHRLEDFSSLLTELKTTTASKTPAALREVSVSLATGHKYRSDYGSAAIPDMLSAFNVVDGIFSEQLAIQITATPSNQQMSVPDDGETALEQLASLRENNFGLKNAGLTHLFTSKDISITRDGEHRDIVGIAYVDVLCDQKWGVAITEAGSRLVQDALVTAHELGHNFGAVHDGKEPCDAVADNQFLMAPRYNGIPRFSACSLDLIKTRIRTASCIRSLNRVDLSLSTPASSLKMLANDENIINLQVSNQGSAFVPQTEINISTDSSELTLTAPNNDCYTTPGGSVRCTLDQLLVGTTQTVTIGATGHGYGNFAVLASLVTPNDVRQDNNTQTVAVNVSGGADLSVNFDNGTQSLSQIGSFDTILTVTGDQRNAAHGATLTLSLPTNLVVKSMPTGFSACESQQNGLRCHIGTIPPNASLTSPMTLTANELGESTITAVILADELDPNTADNTVNKQVTVGVVSANDAAPIKGGGAFSWLLPLMLIVWLAHWRLLTYFSSRTTCSHTAGHGDNFFP